MRHRIFQSTTCQRGIAHFAAPLIAFVLLFGVAGTYLLVASQAATPSIAAPVPSGYSGICLDDYENHAGANTSVDASACNGTAAQVWHTGYGDGEIRHISGSLSTCIGVKGNSLQKHSPVVTLNCSKAANDHSIKWKSTAAGQLSAAANTKLCITMPDPSQAALKAIRGKTFTEKLWLDSCSLNQTGQKWKIQWGKPTPTKSPSPTKPVKPVSPKSPSGGSPNPGGPIKNADGTISNIVTNGYGQCLNDNNGSTGPNAAVQAATCNGNKAEQTWTTGYGSGQIEIHGQCLGVDQNGTAAGQAITTLTCAKRINSDTLTLQTSVEWTSSKGELVNVASSRCLSSSGFSKPASGTQLSLEPCDGRAGELWKISWPSTAANLVHPGGTRIPVSTGSGGLPTGAATTPNTPTQANEQADLQYLIDTYKSGISCSHLQSAYAKQLLNCR